MQATGIGPNGCGNAMSAASNGLSDTALKPIGSMNTMTRKEQRMMKRYRIDYTFCDGEPVHETIEHTNWHGAMNDAAKFVHVFSADGVFYLTPLDEEGYRKRCYVEPL